MSKFKWHFPTTDNGDEDGLNDPLRETFEGDHERFVARETLQNSGDARVGDGAVRVDFERVLLPGNQIPGRDELVFAIERAKEYTLGQEGAEEFYSEALRIINSNEVPVLRISDYNTTGLNGNDDEKEKEWYRLIRAVGANTMSGAGGGSFGIGKGAPFAASGLRTVFYSTINEAGDCAFQGKCRISSFILDGDVKRGSGFFGLEQSKGVSAIRDPLEIPEAFRRTETGTDIYIIGYLTEELDWRNKLIQSIISNFWGAIHFNELRVSFSENGVKSLEIDSGNLEQHLIELPHAGKEAPLHFYRALTEGTKIDGSLKTLGDCSIYVKKAEGYPKMVQMMRKSKMVIKTTPPGAFRVLGEPFAAVFVCFSTEGNKQLRLLEPPAHNDWDPDRDKKCGSEVISELNDFVRNSLRSLAEETGSRPEEIPDLSYYLPEEDDLDKRNGADGDRADGSKVPESPIEKGINRDLSEAELSQRPIQRRLAIVRKAGLGGTETSERSGDGMGRGKKGSVDRSAEGKMPYIDASNIVFRGRRIQRGSDSIYQVVITPIKEDSGSLRIAAVGEDARYPVELESVTTVDGKDVQFNGSTIENLELVPEIPLKLLIRLKTKRKYALGVGTNDSN